MNVLTKQSRFLLIALMPLTVALSIGGCPAGGGGGGGGGGNADPTANAGADQNVTTNATVNLNGTASTDPDGDTLTFAWSQTGGASVTLTGATTTTATFTAPGTAGALTFELSVDDGNGGNDTDTVVITVSAPPPPPVSCGDGNLDAGETCDNGALNSDVTPDACRTNCHPASCGDGVVDTGEACDDGNITDGDGCSSTCQIEPPVLFVAGFLGNNVVSFTDDGTLNGNVAPDTNLFGPSTGLHQPADIIVTQNGSLLASNLTGPLGAGPGALTRYDSALTATANTAFDGQLSGAATLLTSPASLTVNVAQDLVFVANFTSNVISVYNNASGLNGNTAPIRTIFTTVAVPPITSPTGVNFGVGSDDLYVANSGPGGGNVFVYSNASTRSGDLAPDRVISSAAFTGVFDVFVDGSDNLFVVNNLAGVGSILIFQNASTLNGPLPVNPDITLVVPGAVSFLTAIVVGSDGTGYIIDSVAAGRVLIYDNIATQNGTIAADRTITGPNTKLTTPIRAFLLEH